MKKAKKTGKKAKKKAAKKKAVKKRVARGVPTRKKPAKRIARRAAGRAPRQPRPARRFVPEGSDSLLVVMSGPSGAGKSTLARRLALAEGRIWRSVSMTTRAPRAGEQDGIDYLFTTREEFARAVERGAVLEHAMVHGEMYGTPGGPVTERLLQGRDVLLEIDVQGAVAVRKAAPDAVFIFVVPPSREVLERRLRERRSEDEDMIQSRLRRADEEVDLREQYDYLVTNDDLERAVADALAVMSAERNRMHRRRGFTWRNQ